MIPSLEEIVSSIRGLFRLAAGDPDGLNDLNLTAEGFWRSFFAGVMIFPLLLGAQAGLIRASRAASGNGAEVPGLAQYFVIFLLSWFGFVLIMIPVARLLAVADRYAVFIIAWNWRQIVDALLILPPVLLAGLGLMPFGFAQNVAGIASLAVLALGWWIAHVALGVSKGAAVAVIILEVVCFAFVYFTISHISV